MYVAYVVLNGASSLFLPLIVDSTPLPVVVLEVVVVRPPVSTSSTGLVAIAHA
jgi:hypothetical protein